MGHPNGHFELSAPRCPKEAPRGPQDAPRRPQEGPKEPPRGSEEAPEMPQNCLPEAPESHAKRPQEASMRTLTLNPGTVAGLPKATRYYWSAPSGSWDT